MGILSDEVYDNIKEYFVFDKETNVRINSTITTVNGTYENFKTYEGDGGMYILRSDGTLIFSKNGNFLTINDYHKETNSLGIELTGDNLELSIFAPVVKETDGVATGAITLSHAYGEDVIVTMYTQDDTDKAGIQFQSHQKAVA